jgi:hypothetical protein
MASLQYQYQQATPGNNYQVQSTSLSQATVFEFNPFVVINQDLELGLAVDYWSFTSLNFDVTDVDPEYYHNYEHNLSSYEVNAKIRFYPIETADKGFRFFLEASGGVMPIQYQVSDYYQDEAPNAPVTFDQAPGVTNDQVGENVSSMALDGTLKAGFTFGLGTNGSLSLSAGYQYAYASGFTGTWSDSAVSAKNGVAGSDRVYPDPNGGPNYIAFTPTSSSNYFIFNHLTPAVVATSQPLVVDLSGLRASVDFAFRF